MKSRKMMLIIPILGMGIFILYSRETLGFASQGIELCLRTVIPSLFPFFLLSGYLTGNLTGAGLSAMVVSGFLGGYPIGARSVAESWRTGHLSRSCANRMLMFCSQAGPSFFFGIVAAAFPELKYAWMLWAVQILSAASVGVLVYKPNAGKIQEQEFATVNLSVAMKNAILAMASVCGWVVIFRVVLGFLEWLPMDEYFQVMLSGFLELANGCLKLSGVERVTARFLVAAVMLNFGGICVLMQTASLIQGLDLRYYLFGKVLQTGFALLYSMVFLGYYGALIPIFTVFLLFGRRNTAKKSSIPASIGV